MSEASESERDHHQLTALREEAQKLAAEMFGPLRRIRVSSGDAVLEVEWQQHDPTPAVPYTEPDPANPRPPVPAPVATAAQPSGGTETSPTQDTTVAVTAPMIGTFYHAPSPTADPYVRVGDVVEAGQTIGIIEAMKLMNPITAEVGGTVVEVPVDNAETVEFGQVLVRLEPSTA